MSYARDVLYVVCVFQEPTPGPSQEENQKESTLALTFILTLTKPITGAYRLTFIAFRL